MITESLNQISLEEYAKKYSIEELSSEDILKLMNKPYIISNIANAFHITVKQFNQIRKQKGVNNSNLENTIRNLDVFLYYIDSKKESISNEDRNEIINLLIPFMTDIFPNQKFYQKKLSQMNFTKENIINDIKKRGIDIEYRLEKWAGVIETLDKVVASIAKEKIHNALNKNDNHITIDMEGKTLTFQVSFSEEKYNVNTTQKGKKSNISHRNQKKENETKIQHGKIGELLALEAEKKRLISIGLEDYIENVKLVAQIDEETTLDGTGYDLISVNEAKEPICIEVKTSFGKKDRPFFISKKEIELLKGLKEEHTCKQCLIYYILIDDMHVTIKTITPYDLDNLKLTPVLYKVG